MIVIPRNKKEDKNFKFSIKMFTPGQYLKNFRYCPGVNI